MKREDLVEQYVDAHHALNKEWRKRMFAMSGNAALSPTQLGLIFTIEHSQPVSGKDLAAKLGVSRSAITQMLDNVDDYVIREHDVDDRRIVHISLSTGGKQKMQELHKTRKQLFTQSARNLTDQEIETMITIQKKMIQEMEQTS